jgi:ParB family chromosome partitioning protein
MLNTEMTAATDIKHVEIEYVSPQSLHPHARNSKIYGDEDVEGLKQRILSSKWIKPLVVTQHNTIISGHRRWRAARELGLLSVPVERLTFDSEIEELMALLLENESRDKTVSQRVREAALWKEIEDEMAAQRQSLAAIQTHVKLGYKSPGVLQENFPEALKGQSRDKLAERVGLGSGRNYEKADKVVEFADKLVEQGKEEEAQKLLETLDNKSVHSAYQQVKNQEKQEETEDEEAREQRQGLPALNSAGVPVAVPHILSRNNEWYTPAKYVDAARELMGTIDLDPASCESANETIKATRYYDKQTNGFDKPWNGHIWLNPPYGREDGSSNQEAWSRRLIEQYQDGITQEAILLVNAAVDTKWFQRLFDYPICFPHHRINFTTPEPTASGSTHGSALIYFGPKPQEFARIFSQFGVIVQRYQAC